ncbi:MAG: serine/threonine-protein kinase [Actinocrinis sp.]
MTSTDHHYSQQIDEGTLIAGRYRLTRWLGLGAMGEVWAALDERLGREVAVKLVLGDPRTDPDAADRFTREAIAVARINHPNVVGVYDQGEHQRHQFVVMELVNGCNLDELRGGRPMPVGAALAVSVQLARALEAAHRVGVLHRDIKPANVMITHDGIVKVLDFGIAELLHGTGFTERLTRTGADSLGTPAYTAPERIAGGQADPRSDLYSVGCLMYALLTGLPPFPADDSLTILHRHLHDEPTPVRHWRPEVAAEVDRLVLWLLAKDPQSRPTCATEVAGRLESLSATYPGPESALGGLADDGGSLARLFAAASAEATVAIDEVDLPSRAVRGGDGGADGGGDAHDGGAGRGGGSKREGYVKTGRHRTSSLLLAMCVVAGLGLGVLLSHQSAGGPSGPIGAMPSADAPRANATGTRMPAMNGAGDSAKPASDATGNASPGTPSGAAAGSGTGSSPGMSQTSNQQLSNVAPSAPITPYLRYTAVAPGNGCETFAPGQFKCAVGSDHGAPVFAAGTLDQIGSVGGGPQRFYCQSSGAEYSNNAFRNHWWAWTRSDQGDWGWVNAVYLAGGDNDSPEPGLPYCGS